MKRRTATKTVKRLRKLRRDREWTQRYLGGLVGVEGATISLYESGDARPSLDVAEDLAKVFGCSIEELFEPVEIPA
jgi:putative transcriptional regulator